ncbi:hypothetical protein [Salinicoccus albus]|uniref:hypothetical protein n=1 Tax=Salinicoccus albus TaxID=418756 RepID=UPI0012EA4122|nr:hypothetical protein [Salinicoccus albus]
MSPREYSRDQMASAAGKLKNIQASPCCNNPNFEIRPEVSLLTSRTDDSEIVSTDMLSVLCKNCGLMQQYDPKVLGI